MKDQGGGRARLMDDLAGVAGGAFSVLTGIRAEVEAIAKSQAEAIIRRLDLVRREELDAAMDVARRAREQAEDLAARVEAPKHFQAKWNHLATRKMRQNIPRLFRNQAANPHLAREGRIVTYSLLQRDSAPA